MESNWSDTLVARGGIGAISVPCAAPYGWRSLSWPVRLLPIIHVAMVSLVSAWLLAHQRAARRVPPSDVSSLA